MFPKHLLQKRLYVVFPKYHKSELSLLRNRKAPKSHRSKHILTRGGPESPCFKISQQLCLISPISCGSEITQAQKSRERGCLRIRLQFECLTPKFTTAYAEL